MSRGEHANPLYDIRFIAALFDEEGGDLHEVQQAILGHLQQGGDPSPFDRILATRLAAKAIDFLIEKPVSARPYDASVCAMVGL